MLVLSLLTACKRSSNDADVVFSLPRVAEKPNLCLLRDGLYIEFNTGDLYSSIPQGVLEECRRLDYEIKDLVLSSDFVMVYPDGTSQVADKGEMIVIPFTDTYTPALTLFVRPDSPKPYPHITIDRILTRAIGRVLCYYPDHVEIRNSKPSGFDVTIPIEFLNAPPVINNLPTVNLTVNGKKEAFVLHTGCPKGLILPLDRKKRALGDLEKELVTDYFGGKTVVYEQFNSLGEQVQIGYKTFYTPAAYTGFYSFSYIFNPLSLGLPVYIDLEEGELGINTNP